MELIFGFIIGFCYSLLAVTSMILFTRYTIIHGWRTGMASALGFITAQLIWAIAGILFLGLVGFHATSSGFSDPAYFIIPGSILIFYLAYKVYTAPMPSLETEAKQKSLGAFSLLFSLAISRPMRLFGYAGLYALTGAHINVVHYGTWLPLVIGVMIGVSIYWFGLLGIILRLKEKITPEGIYKFSKIGAIIIAGLGVLSLLSLL